MTLQACRKGLPLNDSRAFIDTHSLRAVLEKKANRAAVGIVRFGVVAVKVAGADAFDWQRQEFRKQIVAGRCEKAR